MQLTNQHMKYSMQFFGNDNKVISSMSFKRELNVDELKEEFNNNFVRNGNIKAVQITFYTSTGMIDFVAGVRGNKVVIVDVISKKEYTCKQFSAELDTLKSIQTLCNVSVN